MSELKILNNRTILITRPLHQAENLCHLIRNAGGNPVLFPTLEIVPSENLQPLLETIKHLADFDAAIFLSVNAVIHAMPHWPTVLPALKIFAVGSATAKKLSDFKVNVEIPAESQFSSEGLLAMPDLQAVKNKRILIFSGENGRTLLAETLTHRGAKVTKIEVYRRIIPSRQPMNLLETLQKKGVDMIICTSNEGLQNLSTMFDDREKVWLQEQQLLVISERMIETAKNLGFKRTPIIADHPSDEGIYQALQKFYLRRFTIRS